MILLKNKKQIDGIRKSCKLAAKALNWIEDYVQPNVTTAYLDELLHKFILDHKAIPAPLGYKGYPKATCISVNEVVCHGIPSDRKIFQGDILNIDVTTILDGYYGDTSRMFFVGKIDEKASHLCKIAKDCLYVGINQVKPGKFVGDIGSAIEKLAISNGYSSANQFCGHGVGLDFHEEPQIPHFYTKDPGPALRSGMVFTIEPMINEGVAEAIINEHDGWTAVTADRKLSAQYEHTILVTDDGYEILTLENEDE